jgi:hypothetical protein
MNCIVLSYFIIEIIEINAISTMGENPPNPGLVTRQSLDTLKDRNASILTNQIRPNDN